MLRTVALILVKKQSRQVVEGQFIPHSDAPLTDNAIHIATPEGVAIQMSLAGLGSRAMAWSIDAALKLVLTIFLSIVLGLLGRAGGGLHLIAVFTLLWFYNILFEVLYNGSTPGKVMVGIRVVRDNGTPVGWGESVLRNLVRSVDALPGTYVFGAISVLLSARFQRLGDMAAGTLVVYAEGSRKPAPKMQADPVPVSIPLSLREQQALVAFGDRAHTMTEARQTELAEIVAPLIGDGSGERLIGHASYLAGRNGLS